MSWDSSDVPEPFRYSRAHSYPASRNYGRSAPPEPEGRGRMLVAALVAFAVVALLGLAVFNAILGSDPAPSAQPNPCAETAPAGPSLPDVSDVVPPAEGAAGAAPRVQLTAVPTDPRAGESSRRQGSADAVLERLAD